MADFTSWPALVADLKNALSNRDLTVGSYRTPDGRLVQYRTVAELQALLGWAQAQASAAAASSGAPSRRVSCRPQGGY